MMEMGDLIMADGNDKVQFRASPMVRDSFLSLAELEGGGAAIAETVVKAAELTRAARRNSQEAFSVWVIRQAQIAEKFPDGIPGEADRQRAHKADVDKARAEGFEAGRKSGTAATGRGLETEWKRLDRERKAFEDQKLIDSQAADAVRRRLAEERADFEAEIRAAQSEFEDAREVLRAQGRTELVRTIYEMERGGASTRAIRGMIAETAQALVREQLQGGAADAGTSLIIAGQLIERAAQATGDSTVGVLSLSTPAGWKSYVPLWQEQGADARTNPPFKPTLRVVGQLVGALSSNFPVSTANLLDLQPEQEEVATPYTNGPPRALPAAQVMGGGTVIESQAVRAPTAGRKLKRAIDFEATMATVDRVVAARPELVPTGPGRR